MTGVQTCALPISVLCCNANFAQDSNKKADMGVQCNRRDCPQHRTDCSSNFCDRYLDCGFLLAGIDGIRYLRRSLYRAGSAACGKKEQEPISAKKARGPLHLDRIKAWQVFSLRKYCRAFLLVYPLLAEKSYGNYFSLILPGILKMPVKSNIPKEPFTI